MDIKALANTITITGNIKSIQDFSLIKTTVDNVASQNTTITIKIVDSLSITSSVIGYLNKLIIKDKVNITMLIGNTQLIDLLNDLNLTSTFKARKI